MPPTRGALAHLVIALISLCAAAATRLERNPWRKAERLALRDGVLGGSGTGAGTWAYDWEERWYSSYADQFNFAGKTSADTWQQRYLINSQWWGGPGSPIFYYCGNEGYAELFANATGALWEAAPAYRALVVFVEHRCAAPASLARVHGVVTRKKELNATAHPTHPTHHPPPPTHRFYGKSMPFGSASYDPANLGLLSIEQALADYSNLLASLQANLSATSSPVIAWGGSYGGMLAAWFRMRYPHRVAGALASSAPILQVPGLMDPKAYNRILLEDFAGANAAAPAVVAAAFTGLLAAPRAAWPQLQAAMRMCKTWETVDDIYSSIYFVLNAWGFLCMADYPYPSSFLGPLPAWPVNVSAAALTDAGAPLAGLLQQIADGPLAVFYNTSGQAGACFNDSSSDPPGLQGDGWDVQCCKEVVQPIGAYGLPNDVGPVSPFDVSQFIRGCQQQFDGLTPRPYMLERLYGDALLRGASNMVLTSGSLDPWRAGDVVTNSSATAGDVIVLVIPGAAHHLDLRASNAADPPAVTAARAVQRAAMDRWIAQHAEQRRRSEL